MGCPFEAEGSAMRHALRVPLIVPLLLCAVGGSRAQENFSKTTVFGFARSPSKETAVPKAQEKDKLGLTADLKVRPNTATELYLWVLNPTENDDTFTVELSGGGVATARTKVTIPGNTWVPVVFPKAPPPPAPAAPPTPPAPPTPGTPPVPAPEPPPPGTELLGDKPLTLRLLDKNGEPVRDAAGKGRPYGADFPVTILAPSQYVQPSATGDVKAERAITTVTLTVTQGSNDAYPGSAAVQLIFP